MIWILKRLSRTKVGLKQNLGSRRKVKKEMRNGNLLSVTINSKVIYSFLGNIF